MFHVSLLCSFISGRNGDAPPEPIEVENTWSIWWSASSSITRDNRVAGNSLSSRKAIAPVNTLSCQSLTSLEPRDSMGILLGALTYLTISFIVFNPMVGCTPAFINVFKALPLTIACL